MSERELFVLALMALFGVIFGWRVAQSSVKREPIQGGAGARVFNLLGAAGFVAVLPGVLCGLVLGVAHNILPIAIGLMLFSLISMFGFAVFERPARVALPAVPQEDRGWTEEDARKSGL